MGIESSVTSLTMSDGTSVPVAPKGIVVFVGPNNSGKSLSLRNIYEHLIGGATPPHAVKDIRVEKSGTADELTAWLESNFPIRHIGGHKNYVISGGDFEENSLTTYWSSGPPYQHLALAFVFFAAGGDRLQAVNPAESFDVRSGTPVHPIQAMYKDPELEKRLSNICIRAFGKPLFLDRFAGNRLYLSVGEPPPPPENVMSPPKDYLDTLSSFPTIDQQGDGMKSFVGLMLHLLSRPYQTIIVDEPEAFLHPPQARLMGRLLVEEKPVEAQVFVATHDNDVLTGILDAPEANVTVVRLDWDGEVNHASHLDPKNVRALWQDPLLRYSNILDGLFHEAVVLCEGDADCRFYASVLDAVEPDMTEAKRPDLLFTHCGGKHRMPMVIAALRAVSVPVRVVADFDVLREEQPLRGIVENLGGEWASVEADWSVVKSALDSDSGAPSTDWVMERVTEYLAGITTSTLRKEDTQRVRELTRAETGWDKVKRSGKSAVQQGQPTERVERLLSNLREIGLFVVEVGELERFAPAVGGHGPAWVNAVHEQGLHADRSLTEAQEFVVSVAQSAGS